MTGSGFLEDEVCEIILTEEVDFPGIKHGVMKLIDHRNILVGWVFVIAAGLGAFQLSRNHVEANRRIYMKSRERMRNANVGDYEVGEKYLERYKKGSL